ncbi:hypothetical protein O6H91_17G030100 [Diphasiastrum complanatum]|nr:hypothetical protein O6H91_17G030100 [Diphasiastrum complanatum]
MEYTNLFLEQLSVLASLTGDSMQRVATYFMESLAARITKSWPGVHKALLATRLPSASELQLAHQVFFNVCPFLKFAFLTVNQAILDAMEGEKVVHIIDLEACDAVQWLALLQAFSIRQGGPPHLRLTVVSERKDMLAQMALRLSEEAERLDIPFQFHPVPVKLEALELDMLGVKTGEAVGVSSVMQLHPLLTEDDYEGCAESTERMPSLQTDGASLYRAAAALEPIDRERNRRASTSVGGRGTAFECVSKRMPVGEREGSLLQLWLDRRGSKRARESEAPRDARQGEITDTAEGALSCSAYSSQSIAGRNGGNEVTPRRHPDDRRRVIDTHFQNGRGVSPAVSKHDSIKMDAKLMEEQSYRGVLLDRIVRMIHSLSPKAMVVIEQECHHNGVTLVERFVEALHYYSAVFDCLDSTLSQQSPERIILEKYLFGQEIKNIIACEGLDRVERHERLDSWRKRMECAGFVPLLLSSTTMVQAERLLNSYACDGYRLMEDRGCLTICWQGTPLFSASAWRA